MKHIHFQATPVPPEVLLASSLRRTTRCRDEPLGSGRRPQLMAQHHLHFLWRLTSISSVSSARKTEQRGADEALVGYLCDGRRILPSC